VIRVVKVGGRAQQAAAIVPTLAATWRAMPGTLVVVHGGGDEVSALQRMMGRAPEFIGGRRVTTDDDIGILRMALSGGVNKRMVAALVAEAIPAVGVSGEDAALLSADPIDPGRMGRVGKPTATNVRLVRHLLNGGFLPVVSPLARDAQSVTGDALNVNGDDAAAALAVALHAAELLFVADVPGVLENDRIAPAIDVERIHALIDAGTVTAGMIAKLDAATRALAAGVPRVRIGDLDAIADITRGTRVVATTARGARAPVLA
jgi:acetylglutamate kinase